MLRAILLILGWLVAVVGLYAAVVILELFWNFFDWQPKLDLRAWSLFLGIFCTLLAIRFLAQVTRDRVSQIVSLVFCLAVLTLAIYVLPPEPITKGLFAREQPSPLWYRAGRFLVLALPGVFWLLELRAPKKSRC